MIVQKKSLTQFWWIRTGVKLRRKISLKDRTYKRRPKLARRWDKCERKTSSASERAKLIVYIEKMCERNSAISVYVELCDREKVNLNVALEWEKNKIKNRWIYFYNNNHHHHFAVASAADSIVVIFSCACRHR